MSNEIKMGDKIEFTVVQLVLFLSNFLDYLASQPETWGGISAGGNRGTSRSEESLLPHECGLLATDGGTLFTAGQELCAPRAAGYREVSDDYQHHRAQSCAGAAGTLRF